MEIQPNFPAPKKGLSLLQSDSQLTELFSLQVSVEYTEKMVSISNYPLSAALTCAKLTTAFEEVWRVI